MPLAPRRFALLGALVLLASGAAGSSARAGQGLARLPELPRPHLDQLALPPVDDSEAEPYFPFLAGEPSDHSLSVGDTSHGALIHGAAVRESAALGILPEQRARDLRYGTEELVALIEHAAEALHQSSGTRMWIGNLSRRGGGDIRYSVSHNSGRDADLALCYLDHKGKPVDPPELVPLNGQGLARGRNLRFDAGRTWTVIKALLTYPTSQVQYLFLASPLRDQVLAHAVAAKEPAALIQLAATVIRQPSDGASHNDHLHLRLACSERDVTAGCRHTGVVHPWTNLHEPSRRATLTRCARSLDDDDAEERKRAVERLALLDARDLAGAVARRLGDEAAPVRRAAARTLATIGDERAMSALVAQYEREDEPTVAVALIQTIGELGGAGAGRFLADAVGAPRLDPERLLPTLQRASSVRGPALLTLLPDTAAVWLDGNPEGRQPWLWQIERALSPDAAHGESEARLRQLAAIAASARAERLEPVAPLIELLRDGDAGVRASAAYALRAITNLDYGVSWDDAPAAERERGEQRWRAAYQRSKGAPRTSWLATGFLAAGYQVRQVSQKHMWEIVRAVAGSDHLSFNAQRLLVRLTDHHPPLEDWAKSDACQYWLRWIKARRAGFDLEKPPAKTVAACYGASR